MAKAREGLYTPVEMAQMMLCSKNTISNWENSHTKPSERKLRRWADLTGVDYEWLLLAEGRQEPDSYGNTGGVTIRELLACGSGQVTTGKWTIAS